MTEKQPIQSVTAFAVAQASMGTAFKNSKNPFLKNKYADLTAIQNAVFPAFHGQGFAIMQLNGYDEFGPYVETRFVHISGDTYSGKVYLEYKKGDMQSLGGAITYARRYGLASLSGVPIEDDDGNAATGRDMGAKRPLNAEERQAMPSLPQSATVAAVVEPVTPYHRGVRLMKYLDTASAEVMKKIEAEALACIEAVKAEDPEFATKIQNAWDNKKIELGA
jgi:hypothetical protein